MSADSIGAGQKIPPALPGWLKGLAWAASCLAVLVPVAMVELPPLVDYPTHLARAFILSAIEDTPALQRNYEVQWAVLPNLAMDLIVPPLSRWVSLVDAGRLFVAATLILPVAGAATLHRVLHGQWSVWPLIGFLFVYNLPFIGGALNFLIGIGLYFLVFAGWIASADKHPGLRLAVFSALSGILFFTHLFAVCAYGLTIAAYELGRLWRTGPVLSRGNAIRMLVAFGQFAGVLGLWLLKPAGPTGLGIEYAPLLDRITTLAGAPSLFFGHPLELVPVGALLVLWLVARRANILHLAPHMWVPMVALAAVALVIPTRMLGGAGVDMRLPVILVFFFIAVSRFEPPAWTIGAVVGTAWLAMFAVRIGTVADAWVRVDRDFAEFRAHSRVIATGARLLVVRGGANGAGTSADRLNFLYTHVANLAIIDRSAFVPLLATIPDQQPVRASARTAEVDTGFGMPVSLAQLRDGADPVRSRELDRISAATWRRAYWAHWPRRFDYAVVIRFADDSNPAPRHLTRKAKGSFFDIYKIGEVSQPGG